MTVDLFSIGLAKRDITPQVGGEVLMGFGDPNHRAESVALPLNVRAVVLTDHRGELSAIACLEICFVTQAVRDEVLGLLAEGDPDGKWNERNVLLCATHTHCAPGGHSHDPLYNLPSGGWYPHVVQAYAEGAAEAIIQSRRNQVKGRIRFSEDTFPLSQPVAFNRALSAWNENPDTLKFSHEDRNQALDRTMRLFRFENEKGDFLGCLNEFSVHCTSIHRDYNVIHSDNKGVAAEVLEKAHGGVCIFLQGAAGDVSPNFQFFKGVQEIRGLDRDDLVSARENGQLQAAMAGRLIDGAKSSRALSSYVGAELDYVNFSSVQIEPIDVGGRTGCRTGPAVIGTRALLGTEEGMPTSRVLYLLIVLFARFLSLFSARNAEVQGVKLGAIQTGEGRIFGFKNLAKMPIPGFLDPMIKTLKTWAHLGVMNRPLTPQILPVQILRIGDWAWLGLPGEFTTTAGKRIKHSVLKDFNGSDVNQALIIGYANSYAGYVTTPEEYRLQLYEGASTHFGQWTQPAYQTVLRSLVLRFKGGVNLSYDTTKPRPPGERDLKLTCAAMPGHASLPRK